MNIEMSDSTDTLVIKVNAARGFGLPKINRDIPGAAPGEIEGRLLIPGENTVSSAYWDAVAGNPCVDIAMRSGLLEKVRTGKAVETNTDWARMKPARARDILSRVDDVGKIADIKKKCGKKKQLTALCDERIDAILSAT